MTGLRFCMLTTFYPPYNFGGDGIGIQRLSRALVRRGHQVTVVHDIDAFNLLHRGPEPETPDTDDGVVVRGLRSGAGALSPLLTQQFGRPVLNGARIRGLIRDGRFDVVQFNNVSLIGGPGVLRMGRGAVTLYEAHEHWLVCPTHVLWRHGREACPERQCLRCTLHHRRPPQLWRYTGALHRQLQHVDAFIAKSEFSRSKHREFGFPRDMEVIPYFLPDIGGNERAPAPAPHPRPYFLFVGRLERIKGLDDVIPLFRAYEGADLLIAGTGEHEAALRRQAQGLPRVHFLGRVAQDRLADYYRHAVALIVPSRCFETFGIILIEAFRHGTPVLARRIGPFPEIVTRADGGMLFDTAKDLLGCMRLLQEEPAVRHRHATSGRRAFPELWSESAVVPEYLSLVARLAETKQGSRTEIPREETGS
ncbi:MAG: glycosyltransferase family 4 protein [Gemmatimonadota bacterium]|nr:glycosyltransferase family 4 protein [Gemmatimonadota bacterium]